MQRNFSLDVFRALAILLVFTGHSVLSFGSPALLAPLQFGGTGVDLFFVLSGWLIGNQILSEYKKYGDIDVPRFWMRRWMRTMPAYYAVLSATVLQLYITKSDFSFPLSHVFFLQNYLGDLNVFYVSWSLSVEEQFYLFIAPFFVLSLRTSSKYQLLILLILLFTPSIFRQFDLYSSLNQTHVRLDCCAMGVLLAYLKHYRERAWVAAQRYSKVFFSIAVLCYLFFYAARYNPSWGFSDPSKLLLACLFGSWIIWADQTTFSSESVLAKLVIHISTRSYAMYLLHVDALALLKKLSLNIPFVLYYFAALVLTLLLSEFLHRLIELPVMNLRNRFTFSKSRSQVQRSLLQENRL